MKKYVLTILAVLALLQTTMAADALAPLPANPELKGQKFFVQNTAPEGGNGELATPFKSIGEALARIQELPNDPVNPPFCIHYSNPYSLTRFI